MEEWTDSQTMKAEGGTISNVCEETEEECVSMAEEMTDDASSSSSRWSHSDTLQLIQLYKENHRYFSDKQNKKKTVWAMLAGKLTRGSKSKANFTGPQVYNRWKNLTKTYRHCLHNMPRNKSNAGKCRYFDEMASVYKDIEFNSSSSVEQQHQKSQTETRKHRSLGSGPSEHAQVQRKLKNIAPKVSLIPAEEIVASLKNSSYDSVVSVSEISSSSRLGVEGESGEGRSGEGMGVSVVGEGGVWEVVRAVQRLQEEQRAQDEWRMERLQRMHGESMKMLERFLDVLKEGQK